ncbi:MAG: bifunctional metallophosphatase/5'-nucleotidase [Oscillibacter sp.]|nr:bifunctional metallophosphatase/5'-nucleotidase [Oscillibacter sp.]
MMRRKILSLFLAVAMAVAMALSLAIPALADNDGSITILYTNDIHTYIDNTREIKNEKGETADIVSALRYSTVAGYRKAVNADFLVDAGDHIQGTAYGTYDKGYTIVQLMNAAGYTAATLGNHEFDYDMEGTKEVIEWADYDYVSCNIINTDGSQLLPSYKVYTAANGKKVAFVGVTTPESITKSTPKYFMNDAGEIVWSFSEGDEGAKLYAVVQAAIDEAAKEADYVIGVGHMGVDEGSAPYTSEDIIRNTAGLTAFIDGHSHTKMDMKKVQDKSGKEIVLTQTKCYLEFVGEMTIDANGNVTTKLHDALDLADVTPDPDVMRIEDEIIGIIEAEQELLIAHTDVPLNTNAGSDNKGDRLVRKQETTIGNFCADATYYYFDSRGYEIDVAFMNGGGIRAPLNGDITGKDLHNIYPWGNVLCLVDMTGQQILDGLEFGSKDVNPEGTGENGGFLHVSGLKYEINISIPDTTQSDENGIWTGGPTGEYRVSNVQVKNRTTGEYEPLELKKHYAVGGINYTLRNLGDGFAMFTGENIVDGVAVDYMALQEYVQSFPVDSTTGVPTLKAGMGYDAPEGRIVITTKAPGSGEDSGTGGDEPLPIIEEGSSPTGGCYVATAVYGSYDCPEVWTLRRYRDQVLADTWYGRLFIKTYYAVSPAAVKLFGDSGWFQDFFRARLDTMVDGLQADGFASTPYEDQSW